MDEYLSNENDVDLGQVLQNEPKGCFTLIVLIIIILLTIHSFINL
jgi:hypothetical protein